jgi:hypothetical protein
MLKLLFCSALIAPCLILPLANSAEIAAISYNSANSVDFEDAFVEPVYKSLENCETSELDVFFHAEYITFHSAEYIEEALSLAKDCGSVEYVINPIQPSITPATNADETALVEAQTNELVLVLEAYGIDAKVGPTDVQDEFNSLSVNGRAAILKIMINNNESI